MGRGSNLSTPVRLSGKRQAIGVMTNPYPIGLTPNHPWFSQAITDHGAAQLSPSDHQADLEQLLALIPGATHYHQAARLIGTTRFHAMIIEQLPPWKRLRKGWDGAEPAYRYQEHLGVGIYVYDPQRQCWYQRALHGRGRYGAAIRPYADVSKACRKRDKLQQLIEAERYRAEALVEEGLSPTAARRAKETARWQATRSQHQADLRSQRAGPSSKGLLFGRR